MASSQIYTVIDPAKDPSVVTQPPPPRLPKVTSMLAPAMPFKPTLIDPSAPSLIEHPPEYGGSAWPSIGEQPRSAWPEIGKQLGKDSYRPYPVDGQATEVSKFAASLKPAPKLIRVRFETDAGVYSIPAISLTESKYGILVLLPQDESQASFVPAVGSKFTVGTGKQSWPCFFPGTEFDLETPSAKALVFVLAPEAQDGEA
jgi:hypothetical protein